MQLAYDGLCLKRGTTAAPYFLMKYTNDTVQMAELGDWDSFFGDAKKVLPQFIFWVFFFFFQAKEMKINKKKFVLFVANSYH